MSEETRSALKVFGISVTRLEEVVRAMESGGVDPGEYADACRRVWESLLDVLRIIAELQERGARAISRG